MKTQTIQELAADFASRLTVRKRDDGSEYIAHDDPIDSPLANLCCKAHGDFGPNDERYGMISRALNAIAESNDPESVEYEAPVYTGRLTAWLASDVRRIGYSDDFEEAWGFKRKANMFDRLQAAWLQEMSEVHGLVMAELRRLTS